MFSDSVRHLSQDICPSISQIDLKNFIEISLIIKECHDEILIKLAIVLKISKFSWNTDVMYKYHDYYKGLIGLLGVHVHAFGTPRTRLLLSFGMSRIVLSVCICSLSQCFLTIYHDNSQDVLGDLIAWKVITIWPMRPPPPAMGMSIVLSLVVKGQRS